MPEALQTGAIALERERYAHLCTTLAADKLAEIQEIHLSRETLRKRMMVAGLWNDRRARRQNVDQSRYRRTTRASLIQIDRCEHWWFDGRSLQASLLVFIDDATSRLVHLQMAPSQSAFAYI